MSVVSAAVRWDRVRQTLSTLGLLGRPPGTKVIHQSYWAEVHHPTHKSTVGETNVTYLDQTKRQRHKATFAGGNLVVPQLKQFEIGITASFSGEVIYVVNAQQEFFVGIKKLSEFHHSSFLAGGPALAAGTILLGKEFKIIEVNNHSGHYKPGLAELKAAAETIRMLGGDLNHIGFRLLQPGSLPTITFGTGHALLAHT